MFWVGKLAEYEKGSPMSDVSVFNESQEFLRRGSALDKWTLEGPHSKNHNGRLILTEFATSQYIVVLGYNGGG
jgi:hypothetical protein